jgi:hypothetical protein
MTGVCFYLLGQELALTEVFFCLNQEQELTPTEVCYFHNQ